ncbi:MAG: exodeoxyribonuclease VII small subunit [Planctomycetes bacterium]|nr:exodeoxyribonuclease VII small subunit [Planctomycetota bacterium]
MGTKKVTFEEAMSRLEAIANEIERGEVGLEESIDRYEEGMKLLAQCQAILTKAEQRIVKLQPDFDGRTGDSPE